MEFLDRVWDWLGKVPPYVWTIVVALIGASATAMYASGEPVLNQAVRE